ncbi:hypothetical protein EV187_2911 [Agromyces ramosus]|uniref:Uncharacterized protein n=1 Tax=Agromyces ramosus TaxID=33879 RepID=A0A4Q7M9I0_9MICO|nr:hypothetical protein [Agromyces ramosus]RZS64524.1 hypothetical protein EV187_2911 [Agromyces ramosus]
MYTRTAASGALVAAAFIALLSGCSSPSSDAAAPSSGPAVDGSGSNSSGASFCPNPHGGSCLGPLTAGEYRTTTFEPQIDYTVPDGWTNFEDLPGNFWLFQQQDSQESARGGSYLGIYSNIHAAAIDCREAWQDGVGITPTELVDWYQSVPGLIVSEPLPVTVGGLEGLQVDLSLEPGVATCSFDGNVGIPLIIGDGVSDLHHVILHDLDVRLVLLEWGDGNVTLEITNAVAQHSPEEFRSQLQPVIDSLVFQQ